MPRRIDNHPTTPTIRSGRTETPARPRTPEPPPERAPAGWTPAGSVGRTGRPTGPRYPEVATNAKGLVEAYANASKARSQMEMVAGSVEINNAADQLIRATAEELSAQIAFRGDDAKADAVMVDFNKFMNELGPAHGYRMDPERGTMASLEDNGERLDKLMTKLGSLASELGKVNKEPAGEFQQAYNRQAAGDAVMQEALFAAAFTTAYDKDGDDKVITDSKKFFSTLPRKVDSQIESRGGSMEPLERAGATATALKEMAARLATY